MKQTNKVCRRVSAVLALFLLTAVFGGAAMAQTSAFTYQGRFTDSTIAQQPTNGAYTMTFRLYDAVSGGNQIGAPVTTSVTVVNGIFSAQLDFGAAAFNTTGARYLEIQVGATTLAPRQQITSAPFAIKAISAGVAATADSLSANCAGCVTDANISTVSGSKVTGTVANATSAATANTANTATTAQNVSGVVGIANGGTGSSTQNFVDLTTAQTVGGNKTFSGLTNLSGGARLQNSATDPEAASAANAGRVYFNTAIGNLRLSDGAKWITAGQPMIYHVYATANRANVATTALTVQPGLSQTITVPNGFTANVVINASIGALNSVATASAYSTVDFTIFVDGNIIPKGAYNRFTTINTASGVATFNTSAINSAISVGAGNHTFDVRTSRASGTVAVTIGGNATTEVNPGEMTLTIYYTPITFVNRPTGEDAPQDSALENRREQHSLEKREKNR